MKNILVLGGSELQTPIINYLIALNNYNIYVIDSNNDCIESNNPNIIFLNICTLNFNLIFNYFDNQQITINAVITNSDKAIITKSLLDEKWYLDGIAKRIAKISIDKLEQLRYCKKHKINHPKYFLIDKLFNLNNINFYPGVLKPLQSSGSKDVIRINSLTDLINLSKDLFLKYDNLLYEEFIGGDEFSVEGFVIKGQTKIIGITQKLKYPSEFFFVESGHIFPANIPDKKKILINNFTSNLFRGFTDITTPFHVEIKIDNDKIKIIEFALRLGGDFITTKLIPNSCNLNPVEILCQLILNNDFNFTIPKSFKRVGISFVDNQIKFEKIIEKNKFSNSNNSNNITSSFDRSNYIIGYLK